jgi:hypothetical protein
MPSGSLSRAIRPDLFWSARKNQSREKPRQFPTPTSRDWKGGYTSKSLVRADGKSRAMDALPNAVLDGLGTDVVPGSLNPTWVEWLMGFPLGWTALDASEMPSSRKSSKSSGER